MTEDGKVGIEMIMIKDGSVGVEVVMIEERWCPFSVCTRHLKRVNSEHT